jgi:hypothetical protein
MMLLVEGLEVLWPYYPLIPPSGNFGPSFRCKAVTATPRDLANDLLPEIVSEP